MIRMFVSHQNCFAVPLVVYEHVYEVSSLIICLVGKETVKDVVGTCISINHL